MVSSGISASGSQSISKDGSLGQSAKSESNGLDFNRLMTKSLSVKASDNASRISKNTSKDIASADYTKKADKASEVKKDLKTDEKADSRPDVAETGKDKATDKVTDKVTDKTTESDRSTGVTSNENKDVQNNDNNVLDSSNANASNIDQMLTDIRNEIKKSFGISDEELEAAFANLGITLQDLLQPKNLTDLVCEITGTENAMTLLTDSGLSENLKSLMSFTDTKINTLAKEMNLTPEELKGLIEKAIDTQQKQPAQESVRPVLTEENKGVTGDLQENVTAGSGNIQENKKTSDVIQTTQTETQDTVTNKAEILAKNESGESESKNNTESGKNTSQSLGNIANNLTANIQNAFDKIIVEEVNGIDTTDVIRQIVEAAKVTVSEGISSMELQLNPQNLGKINLTVIAKDGMITAQITAENETVKKAIENQINVLRENFVNQGLKVDAVEVTIASHAFESNQNLNKGDSQQDSENKKSGRGLRLDSLEDLQDEDLSDEEKRIMRLMQDDRSSVEYSA